MFKTYPCIKKLDKPILSYKDSVEGSALTYNAGVAKRRGRYVMITVPQIPLNVLQQPVLKTLSHFVKISYKAQRNS